MDTTEQYIRMCDCEEIQSLYPQGMSFNPDVMVNPKTNTICNSSNLTNKGDYIWLPRQDQLQEMAWNIGAGYSSLKYLLTDFNGFLFPVEELGVMPHKRSIIEATEKEIYIDQFLSMEQLWLAFVMKEKFNKTWDGEGWVLANCA